MSGKSKTNSNSKSKTNSKDNIDLYTPLDLQFPEEFGNLDWEQIQLLCRHGSLGSILTENANELFRRFMHDGQEIKKGKTTEFQENPNLEVLLNMICKTRDNVLSLDSYTFDVDVDDRIYPKDMKEFIRRTKQQLTEYKDDGKLNDKTVIITISAINFGIDGGHYCGIVVDLGSKTIMIFDSMSAMANRSDPDSEDIYKFDKVIDTKGNVKVTEPDELKELFKFKSKYFEVFLKIAKNISNLLKKYKLRLSHFSPRFKLQPTGGFTGIYAPGVSGLNKDFRDIVNIQHVESQNHFCYIWSAWFTHLYIYFKFNESIEGRGPESIIKLIQENVIDSIFPLTDELDSEPLIIIKLYILGIVSRLREKSQIKLEYPQFFDRFFNTIWHNGFQFYNGTEERDDVLDWFRLIRFSKELPDKDSSFDEVLKYTFSKTKNNKIYDEKPDVLFYKHNNEDGSCNDNTKKLLKSYLEECSVILTEIIKLFKEYNEKITPILAKSSVLTMDAKTQIFNYRAEVQTSVYELAQKNTLLKGEIRKILYNKRGKTIYNESNYTYSVDLLKSQYRELLKHCKYCVLV